MENVKEIKVADLRAEAGALSEGGKHPLAAMFGRDESAQGKGYALYVVFEIPEEKRMQVLKAAVPADGDLCYESLTPILPAAAWYEREIQDMFGLVPVGHPDPRPLVLHETFPKDFHPLRKQTDRAASPRAKAGEGSEIRMSVAHGEGIYEVPVGPIHAGIIEPGHFRFSQAGESMLQLDAKLFFTHRGLEKIMEGKTPQEALPIVERICGACSIANTWSFCQAVEKIAGVTVPKRAQIIRTLLMEIERITNHIGDCGNIPAGVGFAPAISLGGRTKEMMMRLQERLAGNRFLRGVIVPGGVAMDIGASLQQDIRETLAKAEKNMADLAKMFAEQENFQNRINTTGIVRHQTAVDLAMVGVGARASSFAHDSRRDFAYGCYPGLEFAVVTQKSGDVAARLAVRIEEFQESLRMVSQLLDMLAVDETPLWVEITKAAGEDWGISESARGSNFQYVALDSDGRIDRIFVRSASYPNWPALPIAVQGDIIPDFPLINKSFELCYACLDR
ncbi:Ni,Fe-hydrogenase III large subunit [Selenomonas sp. WCT3]|uniref:hydrogenase large subunit n=1 Tax=Selenomonas sp. WCT3 TaxID=3158785 RepID=UPI000884209D|nr:Ni,Fe-hydrogenase III large subunit [Selenomonas ruminantium]